MRRAGFAYRQEYHRFNERYRILVPQKHRQGRSDKDICASMLKYLTKELPVSGVVCDVVCEVCVCVCDCVMCDCAMCDVCVYVCDL